MKGTIHILNKNKNQLSKYTAIGHAKNPVALYHGYTFQKAKRKTYPEALENAFKKIRPKIQEDVERLNQQELKKAGKL